MGWVSVEDRLPDDDWWGLGIYWSNDHIGVGWVEDYFDRAWCESMRKHEPPNAYWLDGVPPYPQEPALRREDE